MSHDNHMGHLCIPDKRYWTQGFTLKTDKIEDSVPLFLKELAKEIFVCGKSINLLKACDKHVRPNGEFCFMVKH